VLNVLTQEWDMSKALDTRFMEGWEGGRTEGWERGISRGVDLEKIDTARRMLADGISLDIVSKYTGLSIEKIKHLKPLSPDNSIQLPQ
jgi:predicted transposase/invertase (TIGR01784 family)